MWRSLWISAASAVLAGLVGVPLAFVFERTDFPGRRLLGGLIALPVALPPLVGVMAFLFLYGESGFITRVVQHLMGLPRPPWRLGGPGAILLVHVYSMYVYFYLFTRAALARLDASLLEAAAIAGAGRWRIFRRVTLPLLKPALIGASLLTFMTSLGSFSAPYLFGGSFRVMTTQIVASKLNGEIGLAQVETVALALAALVGLWFMRRIDSGRASVIGGVRGVAPVRRKVRRPLGRAGVDGCGLVADGGAAVAPSDAGGDLLCSADHLDHRAAAAGPGSLQLSGACRGGERLRPVVNSLWMAVVASVGALALGLAAARSSLKHGGRLGRTLETADGFAVGDSRNRVRCRPCDRVQRQPAVSGPVHSRRDTLDSPARLSGSQSAAHRAQRVCRLAAARSVARGGSVDPGRRSLADLAEGDSADAPAGARRRAGLAFITALGDFVTSIVLYTYDTRPISIEILSSLRLQETGVAAVYGVVLMIGSAIAFSVWGGREDRA